MAGADTVIRVIGGTLALVVIAFVTAVGVQLVDPIYSNTIDTGLMTELGWGAPQDTVFMFMGLGLIGLALVVVIWWLVAPVRDDVRQEQRGPF